MGQNELLQFDLKLFSIIAPSGASTCIAYETRKAIMRQRSKEDFDMMKGTVEHEVKKATKRQRSKEDFDMMKGTVEHEVKKAVKRQHSKAVFDVFKGTPIHDEKKAAKRKQIKAVRDLIKGTSIHEEKKAAKRQQSKEAFEMKKGTAAHEVKKYAMRERSKKAFDMIKGTAIHEEIKASKRLRNKEVIDKKIKNTPANIKKKSTESKSKGSRPMAERLKSFQNNIIEGPCYVCVCCNRCLYRKSVISFRQNKYNVDPMAYALVKSFDQNEYVCVTCHTKLLKSAIPCQAVCNKMEVYKLPNHMCENWKKL